MAFPENAQLQYAAFNDFFSDTWGIFLIIFPLPPTDFCPLPAVGSRQRTD